MEICCFNWEFQASVSAFFFTGNAWWACVHGVCSLYGAIHSDPVSLRSAISGVTKAYHAVNILDWRKTTYCIAYVPVSFQLSPVETYYKNMNIVLHARYLTLGAVFLWYILLHIFEAAFLWDGGGLEGTSLKWKYADKLLERFTLLKPSVLMYTPISMENGVSSSSTGLPARAISHLFMSLFPQDTIWK